MAGFPARTASFPTRRQAERWAISVEADMIEGKHFRNIEARRRTVADAIDRYMREELPKKRDLVSRKGTLLWWKQKLGRLKLAEVTPAVLVEYRGVLAQGKYQRAKPESKRSLVEGQPNQFDRKSSTVNRYLAYLSHVLSIARREWHWISHDPFDGVGKLKEGKGRVRFLSDDERARLLAETVKDPVLHTAVILALSTAARAGEIMKLRWSDIEFDNGRVLLRETKNSQPRMIWVHGEALRLLKEHEKTRRPNDDVVFFSLTGKKYRYEEPFDIARRAAKLADFRFHDLRHTAATYLAREGATEQQLRAIGGWKSNIVSRYVHLAAEDTKVVLEKMNKKILGEGNTS
jgi:integrase